MHISKQTMMIKSELLIAVLLCCLRSAATLPSNKTSNETQEPHHTTTDELLEHFFEKYGDNSGIISPLQLCNLTAKLGKCGGKSDQHGHSDEGHKEETTIEHLESETDEQNTAAEDHHDDEDEKGHHDDDDEDKGKCPEVFKVLADQNLNASDKIKKDNFPKICPGLYALFVKKLDDDHGDEDAHDEKTKQKISSSEVWGYATVAITVISLSSLLVIVVIPLLGKSFYNKIMSFLVALAIGCLAGDALLHLIPHSLVPHSEHDHGDAKTGDSEKQILFRAFIIFVGIYLFFLVECIMKLKLARRRKSDKRILYGAGKQQMAQQITGNDTVPADVSTSEVPSVADEPSRTSIKEFISEVTSGNRRSSRQVRDSLWMAYMATMDSDEIPEEIAGGTREPYRTSRDSHPSRKIETLREEDSKEDLLAENHVETDQINENGSKTCPAESHTLAVNEDNEEKNKSNNNHSHHHHHHDIEKSTQIASLAWMVIIGDGFHNLADGLAVGAAFSASFASGISTAVAVFCHELPHELGDFAVLVKAGMTVKQAITYNMVSAIISYMGMIIGILIGSNESSILWVLALTAGMFLYISLVDMLPELCTQLAEEDFKSGITTFIVQNMGILTGVLIMYLISLME